MNLEDVDYEVLNPGGNETALVMGLEYSDEERKIINNKILKQNDDVEQVGFMDIKKRRLEMAGGEFCLNATRCAIWKILNGKVGSVDLTVSGNNNVLTGQILENKDVYVKLPVNKNISEIVTDNILFQIIKIDGILLAVFSEELSKNYIKKLKQNEEDTKKELKKLMSKFKTKENAVGIILLEQAEEQIKINPIIWVKTIDTVFYETACGSGSLAAAYAKYVQDKEQCFKILQPSGYSISVSIDMDKEYVKDVRLSGCIVERKINNGGKKYE